jgi:DNA-binding PucR family transcriptional regulator
LSVTVADILKLPSMRNAEVVGGRGGLQKNVWSISVLESVDPELLENSLFHNDQFFGSEIVITSFINIKDDAELQCRNIRRLAEAGEVGLILFYVGVFIQSIDQRLIALADELDFALICMPRNRMDLRYSEVISEVMAALFKDQSTDGSIIVELLEHVSRLPKHQQTVDTVVKLLSDRIRASVIVTDSAGNVLNEAAWPRSLTGLYTDLKKFPKPKTPFSPVAVSVLSGGGFLYRAQISTESGQGLELFVIRENGQLPDLIIQQSVDIIQLAVRLWSQQHDKAVISELVKAILQDEPMKMRRLADLFRIDVTSVNSMWVAAASNGEGFSSDGPDTARELAEQYCRTCFADIYESCLVIFMDGPKTKQEADALRDDLLSSLPEGVTLTRFSNLTDTTAVREAFIKNRDCASDVKRIFPGRICFDGEEILFTKECRARIEQGEASVLEALAPLRPLARERDADELKHTLAVYLLDTEAGLTETAEKLFLHKNTVKYRLKCLSDRFGFRVGGMPASINLYIAAAIDRLLKS